MSLILDIAKDDEEELVEKLVLNLSKNGVEDLPSMAAKVVIDRSGSMSGLFQSGWVSNMLSLLILAAQHFDDDGMLEVGSFNSSAVKHDDINLSHFGSDLISYLRLYANGGTAYCPAIEMILDEEVVTPSAPLKGGLLSRIFGSKKTEPVTTNPPVARVQHISFVTDGDAGDRSDFLDIVRSLRGKKVFIQMITLGGSVPKDFMRTLESEDHVHWAHFENPNLVTTDEFFESISNEKLAKWLESI